MDLALGPLAAALAAGNRVMLKPSEFTPATSALLERLLSRDASPLIRWPSSPATRISVRRSPRCRSITCCLPAAPRPAASSCGRLPRTSCRSRSSWAASPRPWSTRLPARACRVQHCRRQAGQRRSNLYGARLRAGAGGRGGPLCGPVRQQGQGTVSQPYLQFGLQLP